MKLYAIVDRRAKYLVSIFQALSDEAAERSYLMLLTGDQSIFTDFPEDFDLYALCDLSVDNGIVVAAPGNENLSAAGFKVDQFKIQDAVHYGSEYDKRYLKLLHYDRFHVASDSVSVPNGVYGDESEVSVDE